MLHVIINATGMEGEDESSSLLLRHLLGRPMLAYVLDVAETAGASVSVLLDRSAADSIPEVFEEREVNWLDASEGPGTVREALLRSSPSSDSSMSDDDEFLFVPGNSPLLTLSSIRGLQKCHEEEDASMTLLAGSREHEGGFPCAVREAHPQEEGDGEVANESERISSRTLIFNRPLLDEFPAAGGPGSVPKLVREVIEGTHRVSMYSGRPSTDVLEVHSSRQQAEANEVLRTRVLEHLMDTGVRVLSPDMTYVEPEVEIGPGTVIEPFVVIRNGVRIGVDCHIGPFCQIREGTVLEDEVEIGNYVETKKTQVGSGSKAKHLSYLGDATLGSDVNIGAGTITANYDGVHKHRTVIEDGASTGSNTVLVAPVRMKENSKTGAGSVVLQNDDVGTGETVVGVPARTISDGE